MNARSAGGVSGRGLVRDPRVGQALLDSLLYVVRKNCAVARSRLLAATAQNAEQGRVCAGWCRYPHRGRECDGGAYEYFRDQQVSSPKLSLPGCYVLPASGCLPADPMRSEFNETYTSLSLTRRAAGSTCAGLDRQSTRRDSRLGCCFSSRRSRPAPVSFRDQVRRRPHDRR